MQAVSEGAGMIELTTSSSSEKRSMHVSWSSYDAWRNATSTMCRAVPAVRCSPPAAVFGH